MQPRFGKTVTLASPVLTETWPECHRGSARNNSASRFFGVKFLLYCQLLLTFQAADPAGTHAASGAEYFVDGAASGSGNGLSWASAWSRFEDIEWGRIRPGDNLWISGGTGEQVYRETLVVRGDGRADAPIRIARSADAGHNGSPVIDGAGARAYGLVIEGRNHIVVSGLVLRKQAEAGVRVRRVSGGVLLDSLRVEAGDNGPGNARGVDARFNVGVQALIVRRLTYTTLADTRSQTDGIWSSDNNGVVFEQNRIGISNSNTEGHSDGIQSYHDRNIVIRSNWIVQSGDAHINNHGLWLSDTQDGGTIYVCGNVVIAPNLRNDSVVAHWTEPGWPGRAKVVIRNNLVVGGARALNIDGTTADVSDNVLRPAAGGTAIAVARVPAAQVRLQGNIVRPGISNLWRTLAEDLDVWRRGNDACAGGLPPMGNWRQEH